MVGTRLAVPFGLRQLQRYYMMTGSVILWASKKCRAFDVFTFAVAAALAAAVVAWSYRLRPVIIAAVTVLRTDDCAALRHWSIIAV